MFFFLFFCAFLATRPGFGTHSGEMRFPYFDLIKAKYWAIVRLTWQGLPDTVIIARGAFVLKAAFKRETNSNSSRAAHFFLLWFLSKKKNKKKKTGGSECVCVCVWLQFACHSSKPSVTCHTAKSQDTENKLVCSPSVRWRIERLHIQHIFRSPLYCFFVCFFTSWWR